MNLASKCLLARQFSSMPMMKKTLPQIAPNSCMRAYSTQHGQLSSFRRPVIYASVAAIGLASSLYFSRRYHAEASEDSPEKKEKAFGSSFGFLTLKVREIEEVSPNVKRFRFDLPKENQVAGYDVSSFVLTRFARPGTETNFWPKYVFRPYTPVSQGDDAFVDLIVKKYNVGGASEHIHSLKPGDTLQFFSKPICDLKYVPNQADSINLIAAGSGITPMIQLLKRVMNDNKDQTKVHLLYFNRKEEDILLRQQLDILEKEHGDRFKVTHCLSQPDTDWQGLRGRVTAELIKQHLPPSDSNTKVYLCGPDGFVDSIRGQKGWFGRNSKKGLLEELGYTRKQIHTF